MCNTAVYIITLRPRQNSRPFADDTFKRIFLNENIRISINISLMFVPRGPVNNNPALVQIMAWRRSGDKPLSEPMMVSLLPHICVARPQWVIWGLWCQKQVSKAWKSNCMIQYSVGCNYLSMLGITASDAKVLTSTSYSVKTICSEIIYSLKLWYSADGFFSRSGWQCH